MKQEQADKFHIIVQATLELVAEQGFHGTPMSQVAKQAGVGVGSIYRYFRDKDELIHAVAEQVEYELLIEIRDHFTGDTNEKQFKNFVIYLAKQFKANPLSFRFLEQYYNSPYGIEKKKEKFFNETTTDPFAEIFHRIISGNEIENYPRPLIHALAFGPLAFIIRDHLAGLLELDDELITKMADGCWRAISTLK